MLIFLDMHTTGSQSSDVICSIALIIDSKLSFEFINENKKIPALASSFHHITNEMILDAAAFRDSSVFNLLNKYNNKDSVLVTHHSEFHLKKLSQYDLDWQGKIIDTMRLTKHFISECELFSLPFLKYELKLYNQEDKEKSIYGIKDALCDNDTKSNVIYTKLLFELLNDMKTLKEMEEFTSKKVLLSKFPFGKYQGRYIEEILDIDRKYLQWMLQLSDLDEDLRYSLEYYL